MSMESVSAFIENIKQSIRVKYLELLSMRCVIQSVGLELTSNNGCRNA